MRYLLFVEKHGPYDHDLTIEDFIKSFETIEDAIAHYDSMHNKFPYTDDCGFEGCQISERTVVANENILMVGDSITYVIHNHDGTEFHSRAMIPSALIASWDNFDLKVECRTSGNGWTQDDIF